MSHFEGVVINMGDFGLDTIKVGEVHFVSNQSIWHYEGDLAVNQNEWEFKTE